MLKVHSRCDLACDHCYIYEHADQSWRTRPHRIAAATVAKAAARIAEHAAAHRLADVRVVLHGGEPLLLGPRALRETLDSLRERIAPIARLDLSIQTNGMLLDEEICDLFSEYGVRVGVSLDGDRAANDRHRRFADGRSSHVGALRALALLRVPKYQQIYAGILCTVDIANDPLAVYAALIAELPPRIDFLLPHATWDSPPPRPENAGATPYARWLERILDRWIEQGRPVPIRLFDSIEAALHGRPSQTEGVGLDPVDLLVIETDGTWEQVDSLKTAYDGAAATDLDVFRNSVDEAAQHPSVAARQQGIAALSDTCRRCPVVAGCGGGLYSHRYRTGSGFDNPSVYCDDLKELVGRIAAMSLAPRPPPGASRRPRTDGAPLLPRGLRDEDVARLADGPIDPDLVGRIADAQVTLTRTLFAEVGSVITRDAADRQTIAAAGWELLCALDERAPEALRTVCQHPQARAWAVRCLTHSSAASRARDLMQIAAFAAACAIRAGQDADLVVPVDGDRVYLPTLGTSVFDGENLELTRVRVRAGVLESGGDWLPATLVGSAGVHRICLEDQDPYRDCYDRRPVGSLTRSDVRVWDQAINDAMATLLRMAPAYATQIQAALRAIVPLSLDPAPAPTGAGWGAASRDAFGAVGIALPASSRAFALLLVREVQRMLLDAVLDECDLVDPADRRSLRVVGEPDPRSPREVLLGAFAHLAVAEVCKTFDDQDGTPARRRHADDCAAAISTLLSSGALTPLGERFVGGLAQRARSVARP
ncbi:MAG TPA: FxsB family cyclophane-forming radical SAM/SPASM peptide maturase [Actinocrinis sp.]|nr:FxsB family cyclophane-forming radical SAM/SPASM peptide maturase [Actinocrinis sp.]